MNDLDELKNLSIRVAMTIGSVHGVVTHHETFRLSCLEGNTGYKYDAVNSLFIKIQTEFSPKLCRMVEQE